MIQTRPRHLPVLLGALLFAACESEDASLTAPQPDAPDAPDAVVQTRDGIPAVMRLADGPPSPLVAPPNRAPSGDGTSVVYSSLGDLTWPSLGYQATQTQESGDYIAVERPGVLNTVTVGMSSWACESGGWNTGDCVSAPGATFQHPITLNLYAVDYSGASPAPGPLLVTATETFELPYRPSADEECVGDDAGRFFDARYGRCVNGLNTTIAFDLAGEDLVLPAEVMFGVEYNTQTYGPSPIGTTGPYNSLNVGLQLDDQVVVGRSVDEDDLLWEAPARGVPFDLYQFDPDAFPYATAAEFTVTNEGFVTGGGWFTSPAGAYAPDGDGIVSGNPDDGWVFNAEKPFTTPAGFTTEEADVGTGSLGVAPIDNSVDPRSKFILRYVPDSEVLISDLDAFSIDFLIDDAGTSFDADQFYINVYAVSPTPGSSWYDCRFDYVAGSGSTTAWTTLGLTGGATPTAVNDRLGGACPATLDGMPAGSTLLFISVNLGDTSANDEGVGGYFDDASLTVAGQTATWDFEPSVTGKATFGFVSRYKKGANVPTGNTQFNFSAADLRFHSTSYDWLVVNQNDSNAQFKGEGRVNGEDGYRFMIWAGDHDEDTFRIKIWKDASSGEQVVYDNGTKQPIEGGQIVVHTGKKKGK